MFFCIGENNMRVTYTGRGESVEAAIKDWATSADIEDIYEEFEKYTPTVVNGTELNVKINVIYSAEYVIHAK